jgi:hypothetical protein
MEKTTNRTQYAQEHKGGEEMEVDYAGLKMQMIDPELVRSSRYLSLWPHCQPVIIFMQKLR